MRNNILAVALVVGLVGCAQSFQQVPGAQWSTVPVAQRTALDHQCDADAAAVTTELAAARAAMTKPAAPTLTVRVAADDEHEKVAVAADLSRDQQDARAAEVAWVKARIAAATVRVDVVRAEREFARAKAVDHNLLGSDTYEDLGMFQGQLARVQGRWFALEQSVKAARDAMARANAKVTADKERYAAYVRASAPPERVAVDHWFTPRAPSHRTETARPALAQATHSGGLAGRK